MALKILKYYLISYILVAIMMFLHYPPLYFTGTTIEYFQFLAPIGWVSQFIKFGIWAIILLPFLVFVKNGKIWGNIGLGIFSILVGLEKYIFSLSGNKAAWNMGFTESTLNSFISKANPEGIKDAVLQYSQDMNFFIYIIAFPIGLFILFKLFLKLVPLIEKKYTAIIAFIAFISSLTFFETEENIPYFVRVPVVTVDHIVNVSKMKILNYQRRPIFLKDINNSKNAPKNIVFIMDESIRGDLISINNPNEKKVMNATPFLYQLKDDIINFGNLYSLSNCSHESNQLFLTGATMYKDKEGYMQNKYNLDLAPTIFQYMQQAGYETFLLDSVQNGMYNGLREYDRKYIDNYISFANEDKLKRDFVSLEKLHELLKKPGKKFFYVVKQGIHFPYEDNFDKENPKFKDWNKETETGYFNLYMNAINQAVDKYWINLIRDVGQTDTVVLWQSDHAVNITRNKGQDGFPITHCDTTMTYYKELFNIPGVLYSPNKKYYKGFKNIKERLSARAMFPTILEFAGYTDYEKIYGKSFKNPSKEVYMHTLGSMIPMFYISLEDNETIEDLIDPKIKVGDLNKARF